MTVMRRPQDLTPQPDVSGWLGTGPNRARRPVYVDLLPPCNKGCPAGESIQAWLELAREGRYEEAWRSLTAENPFPATEGRVCYHPCESGCNRAQLDDAVSIHTVERFLGDRAREAGWRLEPERPPSGKRVLIVGAGPSGLSAGYHLARLGHEVEIHEAGPVAGGLLQFGIPAYRLPRADLAAEVKRIEDLGVRIVLDHRVTDVLAEQREGGFDAVFVAIGAHVGRHVDIPARDAARVLNSINYLEQVGGGEAPRLGRRVVVYGAGNTAMDAARTARRLGAEEALIVFLSDREHMEAHAFEAAEAESEGVTFRWLTTIREIAGPELQVEEMELDENGRPQPTGRLQTLRSDAVVLALGQESDSSFLRGVDGVEVGPDGTVVVAPNMMTGHPGIFAGGDMVPGERTVTVAVGHGKRAARNIDAWLRGAPLEVPARHPDVTLDMLRLPIYTDAAAAAQPSLDPAHRMSGFEEVVSGITEEEARREAQRCLSCGNCFECDGCYAACPEDAIIKLGPGLRYRYDYDKCTGCAVCYEQCPVHAIDMVPEPAGAARETLAGRTAR